jgi:hypothetical protein
VKLGKYRERVRIRGKGWEKMGEFRRKERGREEGGGGGGKEKGKWLRLEEGVEGLKEEREGRKE